MHVQGCAVALQALSGTGSLRIGAAFIAKFLPGTQVFVSDPTWGNHHNIFGDAGVTVQKYRCAVEPEVWRVHLGSTHWTCTA